MNSLLLEKNMVYAVHCFLGVIDQRRGSAPGEVQMLFSNLTGVVMALLLVPSLRWEKFKNRLYLLWTPICVGLTIGACVIGCKYWPYPGQRISGVLNLSIWSYLILYILKEWRLTELSIRMKQPFFWCLLIYVLMMLVSAHGGIVPIWYLMIFGGFYVIGVPKTLREDFFQGLLDGIILWFFAQQILVFGFRYYDYVRYKGLYAGETQNGMFYMIAFCAFLAKWLLNKVKHRNKGFRALDFFLMAGCVSFVVFTGGRAPLAGIFLALVVVLVGYDVFYRKSFLS